MPARAGATDSLEAQRFEGRDNSHEFVTRRVRFNRIRLHYIRAILSGALHSSANELPSNPLPTQSPRNEEAYY